MPTRRTSDLHAFRWNAVGARYFVTVCTAGKRPGLDLPIAAERLREEVAAADSSGDVQTIAFVVMPNHIHWLFELGSRLSLGRIVARLKARTRSALAASTLEWQRDFFEHRLRAEESVEAYALYTFLNPYRATLEVSSGSAASWWTSCPQALRFLSHLNVDGTPPKEWLDEPADQGLVTGD